MRKSRNSHQEGGLIGPGPTDRKNSDKLYFMDWLAYREFLICNGNVFPKRIVRRVYVFLIGNINNWAVTLDFQQCGMCDPQRLRPACAYVQSDQSLCYSLEYSMTVKLLTEQRLEFLSLKGGCTGSPESTLVEMPHCWKPHVSAHISKAVLKFKV